MTYDSGIVKFEYDEKEFKLREDGSLTYIGTECDGSRIKIPEGVVDCTEMFFGNKLLRFPPVIPEGVRYCTRMFAGSGIVRKAVLPSSVIEQDGIYDMCSCME